MNGIYLANVTLNPQDKPQQMMIIYSKKEGVLLVDDYLFVISFRSWDDMVKQCHKVECVKIILADYEYLGDTKQS